MYLAYNTLLGVHGCVFKVPVVCVLPRLSNFDNLHGI